MAFENTIHGGAAPSNTTSVYYTGSDTLLEGYALCYDFNAADVNSENVALTAIDVGEEYWNDARRVLVEKCQEGNKLHFAGIVAANSDGVTGPGWITIHRPGSVCNVYAASDCDHEQGTGYASGQTLGVTVNSYAMTDGPCFPGSGTAMVLQDVDRSSTNGLVMAELQTGPPSGGYCLVTPAATTSTSASLCTLLSMVPVYAGVYGFADTNAASTGMWISTSMDENDGSYLGQRVMFKGTSALISIYVCLEVHNISKAQYSTYAGLVASAAVEFSANSEYHTFEWDGVSSWVAIGSHENIVT